MTRHFQIRARSFVRRPAFTMRLLAVAMLLALSANTATAEQILPLQIGAWSGGAYSSNQTGSFSHCAANVRYRSGVELLFAVTRDRKWSMGFSNSSWTLTPGKRYEVKYRIDNGPVLESSAIATSARLVQVVLPADKRVFQDFSYGMSLKIAAARKFLRFELGNTKQVLNSLLACALRFMSAQVAAKNTTVIPMRVSSLQ